MDGRGLSPHGGLKAHTNYPSPNAARSLARARRGRVGPATRRACDSYTSFCNVRLDLYSLNYPVHIDTF